jgi:activating signal cointegrator complex subunit 3
LLERLNYGRETASHTFYPLGKTLVAELAILRLKRIQPKGICVYIAPIKALAGERMKDWRKRFGSPPLSWNVLELSGDTHHDQTTLERADVRLTF